MRHGLLLIVFGVRSDDDQVISVNESSGRTVQTDLSALAMNDIGRETLPIIAVVDLDLFEREDSCGIAKRRINGDGTFVGKIGSGDCCAMDF